MTRMFIVGVALVASSVLCAVLAATAMIQIPSGVVLGALCLVLSIPCFIIGNIGRGLDRDALRVQELATKGRRINGRVVDALPMTSPHGGALFHAMGAQMVLQIDLDRGERGTQRVTVHLVENSELARGRIGTNVTVLEHPDDAALRTLEGYLPNGIRRWHLRHRWDGAGCQARLTRPYPPPLSP